MFAVLVGVLLGCVLLGQWGTHLQYVQMGARLLAFNAGTDSVAKFGRQTDIATKATVTGAWDTLATGVPAGWLNLMLDTMYDEQRSASVRGTQQGRLPSQGGGLHGLSSASLGYRSGASAASNAWFDTTNNVYLTFMGVAYWVGYNRQTPEGLSFRPLIPTSGFPLVDTIYARKGVPVGQ